MVIMIIMPAVMMKILIIVMKIIMMVMKIMIKFIAIIMTINENESNHDNNGDYDDSNYKNIKSDPQYNKHHCHGSLSIP